MNKLLILPLLALGGCSTQAAKDYYQATAVSASSLSQVQVAKFQALAEIAKQGGESGTAAVMAIALSKEQVVAPKYVESEALSWAKVLAAPVAGVAGLYIQSDLAKHQSDNMAQIQIEQSQIQSQMVQGIVQSSSVGNAAAYDFANNISGDAFHFGEQISLYATDTVNQTVDTSVNAVLTTALDSHVTAEQISFGAYDLVGEQGDNIYNLGTSGFTTIYDAADRGFTHGSTILNAVPQYSFDATFDFVNDTGVINANP